MMRIPQLELVNEYFFGFALRIGLGEEIDVCVKGSNLFANVFDGLRVGLI
jgi:hypothetical protein